MEKTKIKFRGNPFLLRFIFICLTLSAYPSNRFRHRQDFLKTWGLHQPKFNLKTSPSPTSREGKALSMIIEESGSSLIFGHLVRPMPTRDANTRKRDSRIPRNQP